MTDDYINPVQLRRRIEELEAEVKKVNDFRESLSAKFRAKSDSLSEAMARIEELEASAAVMREALDELWEQDEMGWLDDGDPNGSYCECVKCGAHESGGKPIVHLEECLQGKTHRALSTTAGADFLARHKLLKQQRDDAINRKNEKCSK